MLDNVRAAAGEYEKLSLSADTAEQRTELQRLARDERRHVELTERLLEIVDE